MSDIAERIPKIAFVAIIARPSERIIIWISEVDVVEKLLEVLHDEYRPVGMDVMQDMLWVMLYYNENYGGFLH